MKTHYWIIALGVYMLAMGIVGYVRTGSPTALYINGGFALTTIVLGYFNGGGSPLLYKITLGWTVLMTLMLSYLTVKRIAAHSQTRAGSEFIFGSMALFALIVTIVMILRMKSEAAS